MKRTGFAGMLGNLTISVVVLSLGLVVLDRAIGSGTFGVPPLTASGNIDLGEMARRAATVCGDLFDGRTIVNVVRDEQAKGRRAFYALSPAYYALPGGSRVLIDDKPVVPIGIVPSSSSYYCNEGGTWAAFRSDGHGLRNPDFVWDSPSADVLIVGDSFAWGSCLDEPHRVAGRIRARYPATINAAVGANGPLLALAAVREIASAKRPKHVLWLFFENDFEDLEREKASAVLPDYLDRSFSQRLLALAPRTGPIVEGLANAYFAQLEKAWAAQGQPATTWYTLPHLRRLYGFLTRPQSAPRAADLDTFRRIMTAAKADVEASGGTLRVAYIPDCTTGGHGRETWRDPLLRLLQDLAMAVVDIDPVIKAMQRGAIAPYFYCPGSHFSRAGAAAAADTILRALR